MCISRAGHRQRGVTLIELIVFIVVLSLGLAGLLTVFNQVVRSSADPLVSKQALAVAEALLEEILLKDFCDPTPAIEVVATTTTGSPTVTGISPPLDFPATDYASWRISGDGIVGGALVAGVASTSQLTLSVPAAKSGSNVALRLAPCVASTAGETRPTYDDVRDYDSSAVWQNAADITGAAVFSPPELYRTRVAVISPPAGSVGDNVAAADALQVVVSVQAPGGQVFSVTGYRYFHD